MNDRLDRLPSARGQGEDAEIHGLERKLDVLRAQLAACQAGQDVGEAGIGTWSRLEHQSQRIAALEADNAVLRQQLDQHRRLLAEAEGAAASARRSAAECSALRRASLMKKAELERYREEVVEAHRTAAELGRALLAASSSSLASAPMLMPAREALLQAVFASNCWRVTRPLRRLGNALKGRRDRVL